MATLTLPPRTPPIASCPSCGTTVPVAIPAPLSSAEAPSRITDLEAQVRLLNSKAAAAADKLADYEDEVRFLRAVHQRSQQQQQRNGSKNDTEANMTGPLASPLLQPPEDPPPKSSRLSSFSALLPARLAAGVGGSGARYVSSPSVPPSPSLPPPPLTVSASSSTPNLPTTISAPAMPSSAPTAALADALEHEKSLRLAAETSLSQTQRELEDLTASLFSQANEMVATERRARAKLEERVSVLERRDEEKRRRLERLEKAIERVERVRGIVGF